MSCSAWSIIEHICAIWIATSIAVVMAFHHSYRLARVRNGELWFYSTLLSIIFAWIGLSIWVLISCARA
jgi:ABC-type tungstate transport system substrate-binding protein